jgi:phosphatidylserine decarboxylase
MAGAESPGGQKQKLKIDCWPKTDDWRRPGWSAVILRGFRQREAEHQTPRSEITPERHGRYERRAMSAEHSQLSPLSRPAVGARLSFLKIAAEGYPFIIVTFALAALFYVLGWTWIAGLGLALGIFLVAFFRDPERHPPETKNVVLAPADGKVISVVKVDDAPLLTGEKIRVSIFMSPFDVHINRMPVTATVEELRHRAGRFLGAYKDGAVEQNEQNAMRITDPEGRKLTIVQVAGFLARRIICKARQGETLDRGERFGLIMFGSRTDLYLPPEAEITVTDGQHVTGGETVIGRFV